MAEYLGQNSIQKLLEQLSQYIKQSIMSHLTLEHLKLEDLPPNWAKHLAPGQTFTVTIVSENPLHQYPAPEQQREKMPLFGIWRDNPVVQDIDHYLRNLRKGRFDAD